MASLVLEIRKTCTQENQVKSKKSLKVKNR